MAISLVKPFALGDSGLGGAPNVHFTEFGERRGLFAFWRNDLPRVITLLFCYRVCAIIAPVPLAFLSTF